MIISLALLIISIMTVIILIRLLLSKNIVIKRLYEDIERIYTLYEKEYNNARQRERRQSLVCGNAESMKEIRQRKTKNAK